MVALVRLDLKVPEVFVATAAFPTIVCPVPTAKVKAFGPVLITVQLKAKSDTVPKAPSINVPVGKVAVTAAAVVDVIIFLDNL